MPKQGQIVPEFLHPHVKTVVNDNTVFQDSVATAAEGKKIICLFVSGKGEDGRLITMRNVTDFIKEFGYPNYRTDGQAIYNAIAGLATGKVNIECMRVMPEDAAYANMVVLAKVKKDTENSKLIIKYESVCHDNLISKDAIETLTDGLEAAEDAEGFVTIPLMAIRSRGRGTYGNAFAIRLSQSLQADKENGFKTFKLEVLESLNGVSRLEIFEGSLFVDAVTPSGAGYMEDIVNDTAKGSSKLSMYIAPTALDRIYSLYKEVQPEATIRDWEFDILFGQDMLGAKLAGLEIETASNPVHSNEGIRLSFGNDGSFAAPVSRAAREDAINIAYVKGFKGEMDRTILSKRRMPTLIMFDANYAEEVKRAMVDLTVKRNDHRLILDSGIISTVSEAIQYGKTVTDIADNIISKEFQHYIAKDPYTGRNMVVTTTYFLISEYVKHITTIGAHIPFVGEKYALLTGHVRNSLLPVVDVDDLEAKEELYGLRMNYFEAIGENRFVRATQSTSQSEFSDLSEEHNSMTTIEIKNMLEDLVYSLTYNFAEAEDRARYTDDAKRLLAPFAELGKVQEADVYFDMSPWERERSILHCYTSIKYKGIAKRGIVEIDINKRV